MNGSRKPAAVGVLVISLTAVFSAGWAGETSTGNVEGVLTWNLGTIQRSEEARTVVLTAWDVSYKNLKERLDEARVKFSKPAETKVPPLREPSPDETVWISNGQTDFALGPIGHFNWEKGRRQSLRCPAGGQMSQFAWYIHYNLGGRKDAGVTITGQETPETVRAVEPVRRMSETEAVGLMETPDGKVRVRLRSIMGEGAVVSVEFTVINHGNETIADVSLSVFANIEAGHDHTNDYGSLDRETGAWLAYDPPTGLTAALAGIDRPQFGFSDVDWRSENMFRRGTGITFAAWPKFSVETAAALAAFPVYEGPVEYPIAPRIPPITPETRTLTEEETRLITEDDWLFQADYDPTVERVGKEITWAKELAARLIKNPKTPELKSDLDELAVLEGQLASETTRNTYLAVRAVKRRIMFKNPVVDFSQVMFIDNPYPQGQEWQHESRQRNGFMAVPGGRLLVLDGLHPGGKVRRLAPEKPGTFWRPDLSFDGRRVLFCFKPHDEKAYHIYEMNVDGTGLRQITFGNYDDLDPIYLPDGKIVFSSGRCNTYVRCFPCSPAYVLCRCEADGSNIYILSQGNEPEWLPSLLHDGRIIYSRWEYTDKALWRIQSLWTMNSDGTGASAFWGNQSVWPDHTAEPRAIPGSERVMFTGLGHHDWFSGCIGIVDRTKGFNFPNGLTKVTSDLRWPEVGDGPVNPIETTAYHASGRYNAYKTPYPLSEEEFLVSARKDDKYRLYLMDVYGNRELIYQGAHHVWHAIPLKPRTPPPVHADVVQWPGTGPDRKPSAPGVLFSSNVYEGIPDLPKGKAKYIRIIQMDAKTYSTWRKSYRHSGPAVSIIQEEGVKRFLGTVPIEEDGSVNFKVPSGFALHFQLLDENYKSLQTMRSFTGVMPGESRGCVGCHEMMSVSTPNQTGIALRRPPVDMTPPPWGTETISYERFAQPVIDKYCGECHQGNGKAREKLDLTLRSADYLYNANDDNLRGSPPPFKEPYLTLVGPAWTSPIHDRNLAGVAIAGCFNVEGYGQNDPNSLATIRPMTTLSYTSKLIDIASSGKHHDVKVEPADLRRLIAWVDANCPYLGDPEVREIPDPTIPGIEHLPVRPRVKTAPVIVRP